VRGEGKMRGNSISVGEGDMMERGTGCNLLEIEKSLIYDDGG